MSAEAIVGIDLGTTNSEIAAFVDGRVLVIGRGESLMLPSCVGIAPGGELLVGAPARNQMLLYPERTVRSIKRRMGSDERVTLGDRSFSPQEVSALILRELADWAARRLGSPPRRAIVTVPAYFSDAQRHATREAGALAGLEVVRILNEPTAASLAYGHDARDARTVMVYDLGGGTFDVSIVRLEEGVTEVLASHGNNRLGGDDFTDRLFDRLLSAFKSAHAIDLREEPGERAAYSRLWWAAERAKMELSASPYATVREESLVARSGAACHLELEVARKEYEAMIRPLAESTLESVTKALDDAKLAARALDGILLVGGSTRTPLVVDMLRERTGLVPQQEIHPDLCVALGAGVLASRLAGHEVDRVLVDISPYSFGPSYLGERGGAPYPHCYHPVIERNTPLPVTRTDAYFTAAPYQTAVHVKIYQGDDPDALRNVPVGDFKIEGLTPTEEPNEVLCRMSLDLNGILNVSATEKKTGKARHITIDDALRPKSPEEIGEARARLESLFSERPESPDGSIREDATYDGDVATEAEAGEVEAEDGDRAPSGAEAEAPALSDAAREAATLLERSRRALDRMHADDKEEAIALNERIADALASGTPEELRAATTELRELLFFVEGK